MTDQRPILVTGASGYVGQRLAGALAAGGRRVAGTFLSRALVLHPVDMFPCDLRDAGACQRLIRDMRPTAVVHCAAVTNLTLCEAEPESAAAGNVAATANLAAALEEFAPETRLVALSTDMVFSGEEAPYAEDAAPGPLHVYGRTKAASEAVALRLANAAVLRSALVYGEPGAGASTFLGWLAEGLARGTPVALFEDEWRTAVFIDDLAEAARLLLGAPATGIFHAAGGERLTRLEFGRLFARAMGLPEASIVAAKRGGAPGGLLRPRDLSLRTDRLRGLSWNPTPLNEALTTLGERWLSSAPPPGGTC